MRLTILALIAMFAVAGCTSNEPGPSDASGKALNNQAAEDAINKIPPELQDRIRKEREQSMQRSGPPPGSK